MGEGCKYRLITIGKQPAAVGLFNKLNGQRFYEILEFSKGCSQRTRGNQSGAPKMLALVQYMVHE